MNTSEKTSARLGERFCTETIMVLGTNTPKDQEVSEWDLRLPYLEQGSLSAGFHYAIHPTGEIETHRIESKPSMFLEDQHKHLPHRALHVAMVGNKDDGFNEDQHSALKNLLSDLKDKYGDLEVKGDVY